MDSLYHINIWPLTRSALWLTFIGIAGTFVLLHLTDTYINWRDRR